MWTETTRRKHARKGLRYSSDLTDAEWAVLEPLLPRRSRLGRPAKWPLRAIADAMLYILRSGQPWRMLPGDFPPMTTVERYFYAWRDRGLQGRKSSEGQFDYRVGHMMEGHFAALTRLRSQFEVLTIIGSTSAFVARAGKHRVGTAYRLGESKLASVTACLARCGALPLMVLLAWFAAGGGAGEADAL